jgi:hypothetical protein
MKAVYSLADTIPLHWLIRGMLWSAVALLLFAYYFYYIHQYTPQVSAVSPVASVHQKA